MGYAVGVDAGSTRTTASVVDQAVGFPRGQPRVVTEAPSVAFLGSDGELTVGDRAEELGVADPDRVVRDYKRRIGDAVPVVVDGWSEQAETIFAAAVRWAIDGIAERAGSAPEAIAVTYPAGWGPYKRALLTDALAAAGLPDVMLVTDSAAAATAVVPLASVEARTVAVYDLGGETFNAVVMRTTDGQDYQIIGAPQQIDWLGGSDFDQAVFSRVHSCAGLNTQEFGDAEGMAALSRIRRACIDAKVTLSLDTETTIPVLLPRRRTRVRLVRSEFEELIRDAIEETVDATRRAVTSAGLVAEDVDAIVLVGGSSRIPLVAQMLSAEFSRPIVVDNNPAASISLGAARIAIAAVEANRAVAATEAVGIAAHRRTAVPVGRRAAEAGSSGVVNDQRKPSWPPERAAVSVSKPTPATDLAQVPAPQSANARAPQPAMTPAPTPAPHKAMAIAPAPHKAPAPAKDPTAGHLARQAAVPTDRPPDQRGRHRHRVSRRYWLRSAGIIASLTGVLFAGPSVAMSRAAGTIVPSGNGPTNQIATNTPPSPEDAHALR